ncbi:MAG: DinB family protein [Paenibacillaceae bacterium]
MINRPESNEFAPYYAGYIQLVPEGHMADTERIMSYRLLRIARGDGTPLPGFEEDAFVLGASFDLLSLEDMLDNLAAVRKSTLALMKGIAPGAYLRMGLASNSAVSARALAYIISGHELHHRNVLVERYLL